MQIISRAQWGARHPDGFRDAPLPAQEVWLHHSVTLAPDIEWVDADGDGVEDDEERAMRDIEQIGQTTFGGGFSYTFAVMPSGRIYQGHSVHRQGAHTYGRNDRARAICLVGNYETHPPTEAQQRAVAQLVRHGQAQGWWRTAALTGGHRDVYATACPGRRAYAVIGDINRLAASGDDIVEELMAMSKAEQDEFIEKLAQRMYRAVRDAMRDQGKEPISEGRGTHNHEIEQTDRLISIDETLRSIAQNTTPKGARA